MKMKVKEVMVKKVTSLKPEDNARDALELLFKMKISGLPVIDSEARIVGMYTEKEILAYLLPSYIEKVGRFIYEEDPKAIKNKFAQLTDMKVAQLMRKEVVTIGEEASLCEAARIMLTQKARRLPVVNSSGKVVGLIARQDVLTAIANQ